MFTNNLIEKTYLSLLIELNHLKRHRQTQDIESHRDRVKSIKIKYKQQIFLLLAFWSPDDIKATKNIYCELSYIALSLD